MYDVSSGNNLDFFNNLVITERKGVKMVKSKKEKSTAKAKEFHLGDILSITTVRIVSLQQMDGIFGILNFMTGNNLSAHLERLPGARDKCRSHLLKQYPQLRKVDASGINECNWREWLDEQIENYGETLLVKPIPKKPH